MVISFSSLAPGTRPDPRVGVAAAFCAYSKVGGVFVRVRVCVGGLVVRVGGGLQDMGVRSSDNSNGFYGF